jgi:hypothetical protein
MERQNLKKTWQIIIDNYRDYIYNNVYLLLYTIVVIIIIIIIYIYIYMYIQYALIQYKIFMFVFWRSQLQNGAIQRSLGDVDTDFHPWAKMWMGSHDSRYDKEINQNEKPIRM